jgi:hypothetical protein
MRVGINVQCFALVNILRLYHAFNIKLLLGSGVEVVREGGGDGTAGWAAGKGRGGRAGPSLEPYWVATIKPGEALPLMSDNDLLFVRCAYTAGRFYK